MKFMKDKDTGRGKVRGWEMGVSEVHMLAARRLGELCVSEGVCGNDVFGLWTGDGRARPGTAARV